MAEMDLRAYLNEIEELIERNQLDEAIAHCRQILQVYPKHLGSYRLLGKAYLEAKRFGDAADIFQRVLSAIPDDFVSHIGMAIVREDEGNLDSAIWHMERAFETNPANPAIRQELSRLIGRRDGLEPHKIRLTRGALARQYAQGELYVQAIAELRSALGEDPDRPDLEVLLGKMYWMADQYAEAKVVFEQILEKLPYCLEANRYMAAILQEQNNTEEARRYHRHLAALDPYFAFVESSTIDPKTIDAKAVRIERTDWVPGQPLPTADSGPPEWVASLGVDLSDESPEPIDVDDSPPWLAEIYQSTTPESVTPGVTSDAVESAPDTDDEGEIPQWMEEAGWVPSNGNVEERPISFSDADLESEAAMTDDTGELTPADIPGWIQDIAPENINESSEAEESAEEPGGKSDFVPEWLSSIASDAEDVTPDPTPPSAVEPQEDSAPAVSTPEKPEGVEELTQKEPAAEEDSPELPTWIEPQSPGATSTIITWLDDRPSEESEAEKADIPIKAEGEPAQETSPDAAVPSWMDAIADGDTIPDVQSRAEKSEPESPSWLAGLAEAASQQEIAPPPPASTETPDDPKDEAAPEWLEGISELDAEPASVPSTDDAPDWLRGIAEPEPMDSASSPVEGPGAEMPDRIAEDEASAEQPKEDVPDWLSGIADSMVETTVDDDFLADDAPEPAQSDAVAREDAPDWLREFGGPAEDAPDTEGIVEEPDIDIQALRELEQEIGTQEDEASTPDTLGVADEVDDDEVFRWLEDLAETQAAEESAVATPPATSPVAAPQDDAPMPSEAVPPEEADESLQWLEDLASQRGMDIDISPTAPGGLPGETDDSPDWLREMASGSADETLISMPAPPPVEEIETGVVEESMSEVAPAEEPSIPAVSEMPFEEEPMPEIPGWLDEATSVAEAVPPEPTPETAPPAVEEDILPPAPPVVEVPAEVESPPMPAVVPAPEPVPPVPAVQEDIPEPAQVEPDKKVAPSKYQEPASQLLMGARQALTAGDAGRALSDYKKLIERKQDLDTVISDLESALERYPNLPTMWQALGDAYMKADNLQEAIKAYQRGMEVA